MARSAVSSLLPRGCRLPEGEEQAQHHSPTREKATWYGAGDARFHAPFGSAPNPVLSPHRSHWLCLFTSFLWGWSLCSDPRGI